jgi:hypothetical protein
MNPWITDLEERKWRTKETRAFTTGREQKQRNQKGLRKETIMKVTIDGTKDTTQQDGEGNGENRSTQAIDNAQVQSSTVRNSPHLGALSGPRTLLPAPCLE